MEADSSLSTDFTRLLALDKVCPDSQVCHLYATVPEQTSTEVFFNAHTGTNVNSLSFILKLGDTLVFNKTIKDPIVMDNVESIGQRNIYSVLFDSLTPNTLYTLILYDNAGTKLK